MKSTVLVCSGEYSAKSLEHLARSHFRIGLYLWLNSGKPSLVASRSRQA
jgi:hypothetical protein